MAAKKLIYRLTFLAIVPVILSMIVFGGVSYSIFKEQLIKERVEEAKSLMDLSSEEIKNPLYFYDIYKLNDIIGNIKKNPNVLSVYIMDPDGKVITDGTIENKYYNQTLNDNFSIKSIQSSELRYEIKNNLLQVSAPAILKEKIGIIRIDFSLRELDQVLIDLIKLLVLIGTGVFIVVSAIDIYISRSISRPIMKLGNAAGEIAKGNFNTRIEIESEDEIGGMAEAFNKMTQDLKESSDERRQAEERLKKLNECFLGFGTKPIENINRLTALCGELMGATCALYNRLDRGLLCSWGQWNMPPGYKPVDNPEGHICYDTISRGSDEILVVSDLPETGYAHSDPNVMAYKLKTYIGRAVKFRDNYVGSLCVLYQSDFSPDEDDKRLIAVIASAIGIEENRRHAEEELSKFKLGIERSDEAIFITSLDGSIIYVNPAFEKIYGFGREEALGKTPRILKSGLQPSEAYKPFWDTLLAKKVVTGELVNKTKDGRLLNIGGSANPILNDEGDIIGFLAIQRDITEHKRAEKEKDRLLKAIDSSTDGITIADEKDRYIYINAAYASIFGYPQKELIGETWRMITPSDLIALVEKELSITMHNRDVGMFSGEVKGLRKDGIAIPTEVRGTSMWDENGGYQGHICIVRDITERKRIEEELKIKAQLLDTATDSIFMHDLEGNFIYMNEAAHRSRGYTKDEMIKINLSNIVSPEYRKQINQNIRELIKKGEVVFESADMNKDKSVFPVEVHASIIESGGKKLILSVARDITERKRTEELLKEKARAELYGFIVSALPVFASGVPSQVRNTLVKNFAERFEKNILPRFHEEMERLRHGMKGGGNEQEMLDTYMVWLQGLFSNFGIRSREFPAGEKRCLEFLNCPWIGEAKGNPIFCFICRTIVIRSLTWTELKGNADQSASIANGSPTCRFEVHV